MTQHASYINCVTVLFRIEQACYVQGGHGTSEGSRAVVRHRAGVHTVGPRRTPVRLAQERLPRTPG